MFLTLFFARECVCLCVSDIFFIVLNTLRLQFWLSQKTFDFRSVLIRKFPFFIFQ